jgi:cerevisin
LDYTYTYSQPSGDGVDIYIIDTGIYTAHQEFEGRATFGYAAGAMQMMDGHGHGTHCAGTAAGKTYGVAKNANLIAVKVLSDNGSGLTSDIIDGLNWVIGNVNSTGNPSIASMSLGGSVSDALDSLVEQTVAAGITVVVAAGNSNTDASTQSPARVAAAITVAAANITNTKAYFSNYGAAVDIWAPGVDIISAWPFTNDTSTKVLSGTSMATPHVRFYAL